MTLITALIALLAFGLALGVIPDILSAVKEGRTRLALMFAILSAGLVCVALAAVYFTVAVMPTQ